MISHRHLRWKSELHWCLVWNTSSFEILSISSWWLQSFPDCCADAQVCSLCVSGVDSVSGARGKKWNLRPIFLTFPPKFPQWYTQLYVSNWGIPKTKLLSKARRAKESFTQLLKVFLHFAFIHIHELRRAKWLVYFFFFLISGRFLRLPKVTPGAHAPLATLFLLVTLRVLINVEKWNVKNALTYYYTSRPT